MPSPSTNIPPKVPIRLITAFAFERNGLIVTSGISATAGERKSAIDKSENSSKAINNASEDENPNNIKNILAKIVPTMIKGFLLPNGVSSLSDSVPNNGKRKTANTLSSAIIIPEYVCSIPNLWVKIKGTTVS